MDHQQECERNGGTWTDMGDGTWKCVMPKDDMNPAESDDTTDDFDDNDSEM
ncbi:MAG TPA: hypothetical protein VG621_02485 [Candidatus Paceibacterota bacterium]|nr:hypothetical protein [Candidatus Paceibacterota bacterium]